MRPIFIWLLKFGFVAVCCAAAAAFSADLNTSREQFADGSMFATVSKPVSFLIFPAILAVAKWLAARGKKSESWAFLAYGSWMTIPSMMLARILWCNSVWWLWCLLGACATLFFCWKGLKAAWHGQWKTVGIWWITSLFLLFYLSFVWEFLWSVK